MDFIPQKNEGPSGELSCHYLEINQGDYIKRKGKVKCREPIIL